MSDTRTYIVPDGQENSTNQMLPWMAMMNGGMGGFGGNGMWNNPFMYLVWMWMMRWMNRGEWGDGDNCQKLQSAVPTQAVFNGYALGTYAGWNGCGCNNSLWG